jgi:hypothetical protein
MEFSGGREPGSELSVPICHARSLVKQELLLLELGTIATSSY